MTLLPVIGRELSARARQKSTWALRVSVVGLAAFMSAVALLSGNQSGGGPMLFSILSRATAFYCALAGFYFTADSITGERREGTLGLLYLTRLTSFDLVAGKLAVSSLGAIYGLVGIFPVFAIPLLLGGVSGEAVFKTMLALLNLLLFSLAAGSLGSAAGRSRSGALALTALILCFWQMSLAILIMLIVLVRLRNVGPKGWKMRSRPEWAIVAANCAMFVAMAFLRKMAGGEGIMFFSPFFAFGLASDSGVQSPEKYWVSLAATHAAGWLFLFNAGKLAEIARQNKDILPLPDNPRGLFRASAFPTNKPAPVPEGAPLRWLVNRPRDLWLMAWLAALVIAFNTGLTAFLLLSRSPGPLSGLLFYLWQMAAAFGWSLTVSLAATRLFGNGRADGFFELLLVSPLSNRQLLGDQARALLAFFKWPLFLVIMVSLVVTFAQFRLTPYTGAHPLITIALTISSRLARFFALIWVGLWMARRSNHSVKAAIQTSLFVQLVPSLLFYLFLVLLYRIPVASSSGLIWFRIFPLALPTALDLLMALLARKSLYRNLRAAATSPPRLATKWLAFRWEQRALPTPGAPE